MRAPMYRQLISMISNGMLAVGSRRWSSSAVDNYTKDGSLDVDSSAARSDTEGRRQGVAKGSQQGKETEYVEMASNQAQGNMEVVDLQQNSVAVQKGKEALGVGKDGWKCIRCSCGNSVKMKSNRHVAVISMKDSRPFWNEWKDWWAFYGCKF